MSKLIVFIFSLMMASHALAATVIADQNAKKPKYGKFVFSPLFGGASYVVEKSNPEDPQGVLSQNATIWVKTQIGDMEPSDFATFGWMGYMPMGKQGDFVRMGVMIRDEEVLNKFNRQRNKLGLPEVKGEGIGSGVSGDFGVFGVFKGGKEVLKLERKNLPIEDRWQTSGYLMGSYIPTFDVGSMLSGSVPFCETKSYLFAADLNLDGYSELFSFEGWYGGYSPGVQGDFDYISLHVNDGVSGKEIFSEVIKEIDSLFYGEIEDYSELSKEARSKLYFRLSKLYFEDFDENDRLDILVWKREYRPLDKYFEYVNEQFYHFEESVDGFKETPVSTEQAKKWLKARKLTWRKGFPDQRACKDSKTEPFIFMADPVLHE